MQRNYKQILGVCRWIWENYNKDTDSQQVLKLISFHRDNEPLDENGSLFLATIYLDKTYNNFRASKSSEQRLWVT